MIKTENVVGFSVQDMKSDAGERYLKVCMNTVSVRLIYWLFPDGPNQAQKDDYIKLKSATQQFTTKPLTITYDTSLDGKKILIINYNQ